MAIDHIVRLFSFDQFQEDQVHDSQAFLDRIDLLASSLKDLYIVKTNLLKMHIISRYHLRLTYLGFHASIFATLKIAS